MLTEDKRRIEVIFSPSLLKYRELKENYIIVIVDILRATTSICTAFQWGVKSMIPVQTIDAAREYKAKGYIVAGERIEETFEFADFGNGANEFMTPKILNQDIVHSTTNGTVAITMAKEAKANEILIGAFSNLTTLTNYILSKKENVLILCSGWKNCFCMEDTVFAGALSQRLMNEGDFITNNDSTYCSLELWEASKDNLLEEMENKAYHMKRLRRHNMDIVFPYTYKLDTCNVVPKLYNDRLKDALKEE